MSNIRFGTDGWQGTIAADFTVDNVARVAWAVAQWVLSKSASPAVVVGYDTRFGGKMFAETMAKVLSQKNVKVYLSPDFVTTPMVSWGVTALKAGAGVMITASHNAPQHNGIKLKGPHGGPMDVSETRVIEGLVPEVNEVSLETIRWDSRLSADQIIYTDLEQLYLQHVEKHFSSVLRQGDAVMRVAFDVMYGAAQKIVPRLFPEVECFHCEENPTFHNMPPEPIPSRLLDFSEILRRKGSCDLGVALDGDAGRLALFDPEGNYIDAHHIILLLVNYLAGRKKMTGKVITNHSTTVMLDKLCSHYGLEVQRVPAGFKAISNVLGHEEVMLGGSESGGIALPQHLPDRDGIWTAMTILQYMQETGKGIRELLEELEKLTGPFACERADFPMSAEEIRKIMKRCREGGFDRFGDLKVSHTLEFDGYKYFFSEREWLMIRPSGTEQVLRLYAEAPDPRRLEIILNAAYETLSQVTGKK
jgi:phosphomannomutase